jgi:PAS domain S-box-containing protein
MDSAQRSVLIIDAARGTLIRRTLEKSHAPAYQVLSASLGADGLRLWREHRPACILLGDQLPDMDSLELLSTVARAGDRSATPVVLLTTQVATGVEAIRRGAQDFLLRDALKPAELLRVLISAVERASAQRRPAEQSELLRLLLDLLPVGVWLTDAEGGIVLDNPAGAAIWGARHAGQEHIGKYKGWWAGSGAPLSAEDWSLPRALSTGEPHLNELIEIETFDGARKTIFTSTVPITGQHGRVTGAVVVNEDVTLLHQAEQALRASEARLRALTNAIPMIVWVAAPDGMITYANEQLSLYCGLAPEQHARGWPDLVLHPDDRERYMREWARALELGCDYEIEVRNRRYDGEYRWFLTRAVPARDEQGQILAWYGVTTDIHDRKLAEDERLTLLIAEQEAVRVRDIFLSVASHEIKNPLTALLANAQLLQRRLAAGGPLSERDARSLGVIVEQAGRMNKLIDALLDVSRLERGQLQIQRRELSLAALVRQVIDELRPAFQSHSIQSVTRDENLSVAGDELRLAQVLHNLIGNAIKYSPDGGPITIELSRRGRYAEVAITDTGIGIPVAALPNLFRRFYRADNAEQLQVGGLGVGLYVVKEIIGLHGGTISVTSLEGQGSTFTFCLPLVGSES